VSFYDRYEKPPWKAQAHEIYGYIQLYNEDHSFRPAVKKAIEKKEKHKFSRSEIRRIIKNETKKKKL